MPRYMNLRYALCNIFYWSAYGIGWSFVAPLLAYYGLNNKEIGVVTSLATLSSVFIAPALSGFIEKQPKLLDRHGAMVQLSFVAVLTLFLWLTDGVSPFVMAAGFAVIGALLASTPPFLNTMAMEANRRGIPIVFGFCRGCGSLAYAVVCFIFGFVLERYAPPILLPIFFILLVFAVAVLVLFRNSSEYLEDPQEKSAHSSVPALLRANPRFALTLLGIAFFYACHTISNTYLNEIIAHVRGSERAIGITLAISATLELPAMTLVSRLRNRLSCGFLLKFAAASEVVKFLLFFAATSVPMVYFASAFQFFQFGVLLPATVYYVSAVLKPTEQLTGQALVHVSGGGLGAAVGSVIAGALIDWRGISVALLFGIGCACASFITFFFSTRDA